MTYQAPAKLTEDKWFPVPEELLEPEVENIELIEDVAVAEAPSPDGSQEREDIHQWMYEFATQNQSTTLDLDPPGGSETIWQSGAGQF